MEVHELREGLWRWTAPHPDWRPEKGGPGGWEQVVGCLYYEPPGAGVIVLIDPLAPPAGTSSAERFWSALDRDVERAGVPVAVLLTTHFHERSAGEVCDRYRGGQGASIWAHEGSMHRMSGPVTDPFRPGDPLPGGVQGHRVIGLEEPEVIFHLPSHGALVVGDALLGAGDGRVRVAPESWATETDEGRARYREKFRPSLRKLVDLSVEMLIVSHGEIVTRDAGRALAEALEAPAWG